MTGREGNCAAGKMVAVTKPGHGKNDDQLRSMFDEWAEKYNKVYTSDEEREERFANFLSTKKYVDKENNSKGRTATLGLNARADRKPSEIPSGFGVPGMPVPLELQKEFEFHFKPERSGMSKMSCEELTEARIEFEEWAVKHGKVYATEKEREKRFVYYLTNKRMDDEDLKEQGDFFVLGEFNDLGELWAHDGTMDLMWWEMPHPSAAGPHHESKLIDKIGPFSRIQGPQHESKHGCFDSRQVRLPPLS